MTNLSRCRRILRAGWEEWVDDLPSMVTAFLHVGTIVVMTGLLLVLVVMGVAGFSYLLRVSFRAVLGCP